MKRAPQKKAENHLGCSHKSSNSLLGVDIYRIHLRALQACWDAGTPFDLVGLKESDGTFKYLAYFLQT